MHMKTVFIINKILSSCFFKLMSVMIQTLLTTWHNWITSSNQHFDRFLGCLFKLYINLSCFRACWYPWTSGMVLVHTVHIIISFISNFGDCKPSGWILIKISSLNFNCIFVLPVTFQNGLFLFRAKLGWR